MAEKLGLKRGGETTSMGAYLGRVRALPGHERFRTGVLLRVPLKEPSELLKSDSSDPPKSDSSDPLKPDSSDPLKQDTSDPPKAVSSEDRLFLFVSFPYFGISSEKITLDRRRESLKLLDFRILGVDVRDRRVEVSGEGEADMGEILVHQARYMIFDNCELCALAYC